MCVIIYQPADHKDPLPKKLIEHCAEGNPDGHGMMYCQDDKLKIKKQLADVEGFYQKYVVALKQADGPMILHFRIGTSGKKDLANAHPHFVTPNIGLVHNGVLGPGIKDLSDTRRFIQEILNNLPDSWFENQIIMNLLADHIKSDKMILLRNDSKHWMLNQDNGYWDKDLGIWYSNYSAKSWNKPKVVYVPKKKDDTKKDTSYEEWWKTDKDTARDSVLDDMDWPFYWNHKIYCIDCIPTEAWLEDTVDDVSGVHECSKCDRPLYAPTNLRSNVYA